MEKNKIISGLKWFFHSYIWIGILVFIIDIVSKNIIALNMKEGDSIVLIPGFLSISYTINRHAAFGIGPDNPLVSKILYCVIATIASIFLSIYYAKNHKKFPGYVKAAITMVIAGALGNLFDRLVYSPEYLHAIDGMPGGVVDFIDFFNGSSLHKLWHYIFNIADCGVVIGVGMFVVYLVIEEIKESKQNKKEEVVESNGKILSRSEKEKLEEQEKNRVE